MDPIGNWSLISVRMIWKWRFHPSISFLSKSDVRIQFGGSMWQLNSKKCLVIPLMEEILHLLINTLSYYLQGFSTIPGGGGFLSTTWNWYLHLHPWNLTVNRWKMVVGILLSYWEGNFSGAMLNFSLLLFGTSLLYQKSNNHLQYQTCLILHQPSQANTLDPLENISKMDAFFNFANPTWRIIPASSS